MYSGTGTGTNIVWTLQSDVRFVYHRWNLMAESNRGTEVRTPVLRQQDCPAGVRTRAERPKQIEMIPTAADAPRRTLVQAQMPYVRRTYMWGPDMSGTLDGAGGVGGLLAMRRHERGTQSTETFWATHDLNGNVIGLVQLPATGSQPAKMAVYDYDPSGQLTRVNEPEANFNPIRFSSKYTDSETGLVYYGYRYLSPELGRWISRDPIGEEGGVNLYGMVGNDAVNRWDLLGTELGEPTQPTVIPDPGATSELPNGFDGRSIPVSRIAGPTIRKVPNGYRLEFSGTLTWDVRILSGLSLAKALATAEHELGHVSIDWGYWNQFRWSVNGLEKTYRSEKCAKIAREIFELTQEVYSKRADSDNQMYDARTYASINPVASAIKRRASETSAREADNALMKADKKAKEFEQKGCSCSKN